MAFNTITITLHILYILRYGNIHYHFNIYGISQCDVCKLGVKIVILFINTPLKQKYWWGRNNLRQMTCDRNNVLHHWQPLSYYTQKNKTKSNNMYEQLLIKKTIWFTVSSKKKINKLPLSNIVHCSKRNE